MLDGIMLETMGVPSAVICTDAFDGSAYSMAHAHGIPWYPFAVMPNPISSRTDEELEVEANRVLGRVVWLLSPAVQDPEKR